MPELDDAALERRLRGVLKEHLGPLPLDLTVETLDRRQEAKRRARRSGRGRSFTLLAAAALLLMGGALAAGSGILRLPTVVPSVPEPSVVAVASASPEALSPSPTVSAAPSATPAPITWTEASLKEDWPAPVREEPAGGATALQIRHRDVTPNAPSDEGHDWESDQYRDPSDDAGSGAHPWADIRTVEYCGDDGLSIGRVSSPPATADPGQLWIAYGVVVDTDRDGVPDWRYGVDNVPLDKTDSEADRWWRTDLHTGRTEYAVGDHITLGDGEYKGPMFYGPIYPGSGSCMRFSAETPSDTVGNGLPQRFYAWASVIANGRVVATDYAPDVGWLERSPDAKPLPKPGGPYVLQAMEAFPLHLSMTLPGGWTEHGGPELTSGDTVVRFLAVGYPGDGCYTIEPTIGPGFDDLVSYLEALPYIDISEMRYDTLRGYRAAYLEYRPTREARDETTGEPFDCLPIPVAAYNDAWILDVDGVRLLIAATYDSAPAETVRSEVRQIVESIQIIGVSPSLPASPSPSPSRTPRPTPLPPAAGPVPPNARSWTVTVDNQSSEPAALFVVDGDAGEDGMPRLVGSATPNVVPAGATVKVTFLFPADGGWIDANLRPGEGGALVNADDIGIPGKIVIQKDGQAGWTSP
jgi:hypothetical protein